MIIDAHSHIGKDYYFRTSKIEEYDCFCKKNNIDIGFLMPMPWPVLEYKDNEVCSLIWEHEKYQNIKYNKLIIKNDVITKEEIKSNPYKNVNEYYYNLIKNTITSTNIKFIPLIHGVLDDPCYLEKLIKNTNPVAVKFHGFASGFYKEDVNHDLIDILKYYDIPIIFHTSVYNYNDGYGFETKIWRNKCSPKKWMEFLCENNLRGVLNHGACLDNEVINLVNKNDKVMIGIGPDLDISLDPYKVNISKEYYLRNDYLSLLQKWVDPENLLFDVDYNWNLDKNGNLDMNSVSRIMNTWTYVDSENILYKNAKNFYKL